MQTIDLEKMKKDPTELFTNGFVWVVIAILFIGFFLKTTIRFGEVDGEEVGVILNKMNGEITIIKESGKKPYNGITQDFFTIDKTLQTIEMSASTTRGDRQERDDLKIKTIDGSDVYVDLVIQYRIDINMVKNIIFTSGTGDLYKKKWVRDYMRAICRDYLSELSTEQFYDASQRAVKIVNAKIEANKKLTPFGIIIDSIAIPTKPHFYKEYEQMIKRKKLADQAVLKERSKAEAAKQRQLTEIVQETNKKNVSLERFQGEMKELIIKKNAEAQKIMKASDAYYARVTIGAGASLYKNQKNAEGILAKKKAEAQGIEELKKAMEGEGGKNMVKLEYAKKLKEIHFTGQPFIKTEKTTRLEHLSPLKK
ncbi:MAG: SPFH domain-containing protein [Verrucomicrobiota bacterium]|nr:SPFH domain-containing protein [Verrucomicrobiota bacterium]